MADELAALRRNIDRLPTAVTERLRGVARRKSGEVQSRARQILLSKTDGTGKTAASIVVIEQPEKKQFLVTVENPDNPNLGMWLEYGTVHMSARPFMRPAGDEINASYQSEMAAAAVSTVTDMLT